MAKYFEAQLFSLVILAVGVFVASLFLLYFFTSRGQYIHSLVIIVAIALLLLGALELYRYLKSQKAAEDKSKENGSDLRI